jgi:hypothetical protein
MFRKSVAAAATAALVCGSAIALGATGQSGEDRVLAAQSRLSLQLIQQLAKERGAGNKNARLRRKPSRRRHGRS